MSVAEDTTPVVNMEDFYRETESANLPPLWLYLHKMITRQPIADALPFLWSWDEIYPRILQAGAMPIDRGAERRVLILANPGLPGLYTTTRTIYAGVQMVKPGEVAPAHRHVQSAIRFIMQGSGAFTAVEGERCYMEPHDLILTPPWQWHDHGNETNEPVIWMDGLDINLIRSLDASFLETYPEDKQPVFRPDDYSRKLYGGGFLRPAWLKPSREKTGSSPLLIFKWGRTYEALQDLAKVACSPYDDVILEYTNPTTGGTVLPTLSCCVQMLRPGIHTQAHRHSSTAVYYVVEGSGFTVINSKRFSWKKGDFLALPPWAWHEHANASSTSEAILFSVIDTPVFEALGLYREEALTANGGHQIEV
jgi:gentisate 1,2-dioxygenase